MNALKNARNRKEISTNIHLKGTEDRSDILHTTSRCSWTQNTPGDMVEAVEIRETK